MKVETDAEGRPTDPVGRTLYTITRWLAILGGVVVCAMAAMTTISITGRAAFSFPIPGDVEMIEIGTSTAVFAFLPYCQLMRGNVIVDFFMTRASDRAKTFFDALGALMYLTVGTLLTWRLVFGGFDMYKYAEKTITIGIPRWTTFPYAFVCLTILLAVIVYTLWRSIAENRAGRMFDRAPMMD